MEDDSDVVWEAPPTISRVLVGPERVKRVALLDACRANPGKWALFKRQMKYPSCGGWRNVYGPRGFVFTQRKQDDGTHKVWVMYDPERDRYR